MHILLDTNILINLVREPREAALLDDLVKLKETGIIEILCPEPLLIEWNRKKEQTLNEIRKSFSITTGLSHSTFISKQLQEEFEIAQNKVGTIDQILNGSITITPSKKVKVEVVDRSSARKAPFHGDKSKRSSLDDALIYFSTIEYLQRNGVSEFVFVTNNVSDFSCAIKKGENLHPDLQVKDLTVLYFLSLGKCFHEFKDILKLPENNAVSASKSNFLIWVSKEETKNLLKYLAEVLHVCQQKMQFIPPDILCRIHPFRIEHNKNNYTYFSGFTLFTNNEALLSLFKSVDVEQYIFKDGADYQNSEANLGYLRIILDRLKQQLIFSIRHVRGSEEVSIKKSKEEDDSSLLTMYQNLSWDKILIDEATECDVIQMAFVQFQLGYYGKALTSYFLAYQNAKKQGNKILAFQLIYCLKWVADFAFLNPNKNTDELLKKIKAIDLDKMFFEFAQSEQLDQELARFLYSSNLLQYFATELREVTNKIREHYESQLSGGYSINSNYQNLITTFAVFETFTTANGLPLTRFSDFVTIGKDFTEGVMLCSALNKYQGSRLMFLDDVLMKLLLFYGDGSHMIKFYNRYIKKQLNYKSEEQSFLKTIDNFLTQTTETFKQVTEADNSILANNFYKILGNILLLVSIVKVDEEFIRSAHPKLLQFISRPIRGESILNHFSSFIHSNWKKLGLEQVKRLFHLCLDTPSLHRDTVFSAFAKINIEKPPTFISTKKQFERYCALTLEKCPHCEQYHHSILYISYRYLSTPYQVKLSELIYEKLENTLDFELYYKACLFDIIDYKPFFKKCLKLFKPPREINTSYTFNMNGEITLRGLNDLMNLVFKNRIKLPSAFIQEFKGISDYYDWLIDMHHFDYSRFDPQWIVQYPTKHYLDYIFSCTAVRKNVRSYLLKNHNPTLANYYMEFVK